MGAEAVGIYGAMMRVIDFLGIVGPIVGTFALPTFAAARSLPAETYSHVVGRINVMVGCVAASVIVIGIQFGWLVWGAIYPGSAFPAGSYALLAVGASVSAASGLPDRVLQAAGEARVVATAALCAAAIFVPSSFLLTALFGIPGACAAWLLVIGGVNLVLLRASSLSEVARQRHTALIVIGILASLATLMSAGSLSQSLIVGAIASVATLLVAATAFRDAPVAISA
jgi:O-antigen/teichoic acid export membrane protein